MHFLLIFLSFFSFFFFFSCFFESLFCCKWGFLFLGGLTNVILSLMFFFLFPFVLSTLGHILGIMTFNFYLCFYFFSFVLVQLCFVLFLYLSDKLLFFALICFFRILLILSILVVNFLFCFLLFLTSLSELSMAVIFSSFPI